MAPAVVVMSTVVVEFCAGLAFDIIAAQVRAAVFVVAVGAGSGVGGAGFVAVGAGAGGGA
jgi:hypothetical protein